MSTTWKREVLGDTQDDLAQIEYTRGPWKIVKEFYADGISLFDYVVYHEDEGHCWNAATLKQAKAYVDAAS